MADKLGGRGIPADPGDGQPANRTIAGPPIRQRCRMKTAHQGKWRIERTGDPIRGVVPGGRQLAPFSIGQPPQVRVNPQKGDPSGRDNLFPLQGYSVKFTAGGSRPTHARGEP